MMDRPHIRLGCFAPLLLVALWPVCFGCVDQGGGVVTPKKPKAATLGQIAFESFQNRDVIRGEKLLKLADEIEAGSVKYDGRIIDRWAEIGREASEESWRPVAEASAQLLDPGKYDAKKTADVTRAVGRASLKAGGK